MRRILLVEDSPSMRTFVRLSLDALTPALGGLEIVEAEGGFDALRLLPGALPDLIITDINMGDINGLELLKFVRTHERYEAVPIILVSTLASEKDRSRGLSLGAQAYLAKPFTSDDLLAAVREVLGLRGSEAG